MKIHISSYPSSYLVAELTKGEALVTEKGALIYSDGDYDFRNKIEITNYKKLAAKVFGKSLTYNVYTAKEDLKLALSPKDSAEIFTIDVNDTNPVLFEPRLHFARTMHIDLSLERKDWTSTLIDGLKLKTSGSGILALKGYGKIIKQEIDTDKPVFVDEDALIAFEEKLNIKTIRKGIKELVTSGEGFLFEIKGQGNIWLQTRQKGETGSSGDWIDGIFSFFR